jgi:hypothetical protein
MRHGRCRECSSFPVTVADYMRECRTMLKLLRLRGIVNYGATAQDVLDTDAIFHMSLQRFRVKTKRRMPRVAQVSRATRMPKERKMFRRKLLGDGKHKSSHYSCEMADAACAANFPVNVEAIMREYSHREVAKARELIARLAYASSSTMLEFLRSGGLVNADANFRMSLEALRGKTKKQAPRAAEVSLAQRVNQERQIMAVDIMFVKQLLFLIGMLVPINLTMWDTCATLGMHAPLGLDSKSLQGHMEDRVCVEYILRGRSVVDFPS